MASRRWVRRRPTRAGSKPAREGRRGKPGGLRRFWEFSAFFTAFRDASTPFLRSELELKPKPKLKGANSRACRSMGDRRTFTPRVGGSIPSKLASDEPVAQWQSGWFLPSAQEVRFLSGSLFGDHPMARIVGSEPTHASSNLAPRTNSPFAGSHQTEISKAEPCSLTSYLRKDESVRLGIGTSALSVWPGSWLVQPPPVKRMTVGSIPSRVAVESGLGSACRRCSLGRAPAS
jgi:hypothetical protein